jgi:hypothetical protein
MDGSPIVSGWGTVPMVGCRTVVEPDLSGALDSRRGDECFISLTRVNHLWSLCQLYGTVRGRSRRFTMTGAWFYDLIYRFGAPTAPRIMARA